MSDVDIALKKAKEELYSLPIIKEYFSLKEKINNNEEIASFINNMHHFEREMTLNINNDEAYTKAKTEYEKCRAFLDNHPLFVDYKNVSDEVYSLLLEIKEILE